ncbi:MAG: asparagine synthase (glutamine-hydrolyzing), partial [Gammaproteobacteria bacterium]
AQVQRALRHRGPDGEGAFRRDWLTLLHTRLAVIDTSTAAAQPMLDQSGRYVIVFNGAIYNYAELYRKYCPQDGSVNGKSDTAVLLHLASTHGSECLPLLDGMFAFAVVDLSRRSLFFARDRFGEKPLYWLRQGDRFLFASEIRALRALSPDQDWILDHESQAIFHMIGSVPAPRTIYQNVLALAPGGWLESDPDKGLRLKSYWNLSIDQHQIGLGPVDTQEGVRETQRCLLKAVESRMVADVPVGVFLSGGYDSSAIVGLLAAGRHRASTALCVDFEEARFSESKYAEITSRHYDQPVSRHVITGEEFIDGLPQFFASMDQPTSNGYNTYFLSRAAAQLGVKVWLSGVGGDELFGGYPFFQRIGRLKALSRMLQLFLPSGIVDALGRSHCPSLRQSRLIHLADTGSPLK